MPDPHSQSTGEKRPVLSVVALIFGSLAAVVGLWFIGAYMFGAIINRFGEPDQSLLFWYLPLLFIGIASLIVGVGAFVYGIIARK